VRQLWELRILKTPSDARIRTEHWIALTGRAEARNMALCRAHCTLNRCVESFDYGLCEGSLSPVQELSARWRIHSGDPRLPG